MTVKGKLNWFTRKDIKKIDPKFDLQDLDEIKLYDILEEWMLDNGYHLFDNIGLEFKKETVINRYHERRYSCMVLKGRRVKGRFILKEAGIQYRHIE